jgi:AAA+ ATPase superfamily predicted ATPase
MGFFGREQELLYLNDLWKKQSPSLVVVTGRRRIGKSTLIEKFGEKVNFFEFVGVPPSSGITAESQREAFAKQLIKYFGEAPEEHDWWELLYFLNKKTGNQKTIILFDEISWMALEDPEFLGIIKTIWDTEFKKKKELVFILCGSISSWIEKNILSSTGFLGRVSLTLRLDELPLSVCDLFWRQRRSDISIYEKCLLLSVTGGIPRYLEELRADLPAEENIRRMCFEPGGFLFTEFDRIFSDLFNKRSSLYKQIVLSLVTGPKERKEIAEFVGLKLGGVLSDYLEDLVQAGFITRHPTWSLSQTKQSNLILFRLSDNYLRFYLKYVMPNKNLIELKTFSYRSLSTLPGFSSMMGLQFENLVFHNRFALHKALGIPREDIVMEGPFFQRKTKGQSGCQIDYMIQMRFGTIYVCEIKFSKDKIGLDVISQVKDKIASCKRPKFISWRPVLIHVNGVTSEIEEAGYFAHIIGFSDLFYEKNANPVSVK